tara:strand:- start:1467 stop:2291 length:825 start_codon:yes stop_codon:yes gene_type:complete
MFRIIIALLIFILPQAAYAETAYDRVLKTETLRCGYNYYEPGFIKDVETGQYRGIFYEFMEAFSQISGVKVEWTALVNWGDMRAAIEADKIDAFCISVWPNAQRAKFLAHSSPFFYVPVHAFARKGDERFQNGLSAVSEREDLKIAVLDNDVSDFLATQFFPKAKKVSAGFMSSDSKLFQDVATKKADMTFTLAAAYLSYEKSNPNVLTQVSNEPLRVFGNTIAVSNEELKLLNFINVTIEEMHNSGMVAAIMKPYINEYEGSFLPVRLPYSVD